jgi:hypothetical protein
MKQVLSGAVAGASLVLFAFPLAAQDANDSVLQLDQCRQYTDAEERLACYDEIGKQAAPAEPMTDEPETPETVAPAAAAAAEAEATAAPAGAPPDDVLQAAEQSSEEAEAADEFGLPKEDDDYASMSATVVRCQESNYKYYFYLDNGQVWRYLGNKRLRYKDCNSPAQLNEDGLGFKLQMDGEPSLRVKRIK